MAASITACLLLIVTLIGTGYATALERAYVHRLSALHLPLTITGIALQRAAISQPDLLLMYGSSEVMQDMDEFQPSQFFSAYPTGFTTFEVAHGGSAFILYAQSIAALGADLRGKKVVISFTPADFFDKMLDAHSYDGLFSHLAANELVFSPVVSYPVKQMAARRMLDYPETLDSDPVLKYAILQLTNPAPVSGVLYTLVYPLGRLQTWLLEMQDHYEVFRLVNDTYRDQPEVVRHPTVIDWNAALASAHQQVVADSANNRYGFVAGYWLSLRHRDFRDRAIPTGGDAGFIQAIGASASWYDMDLMLRTLTELGAKPLLVGRPFNAPYYNHLGISNTALDFFYHKVHQMAKAYAVPVVDFKNFQDDIYFSLDAVGHTSREGWVYVNQVLDAFYHGTLPE